MTRKQRAAEVFARLRERIPRPETELAYGTPFELLVAVALSAQCTDARVNMVTPALFDVFPDARSMAAVEPEEIFPLIKSISYPNNKAKALVKMARQLLAEHQGEVPASREELMSLAGVGRKTANVMMAVAFDEPAIAVDTHVFRVANRIGIVRNAATPLAVERGLHRVVPRDEWAEAHHLLILHGRYTCQARAPKCGECPVTDLCDYFARLQKRPSPLTDLDPKQGSFYCKSHRGYFDHPVSREDRYGVTQIACPRCGSMNVFEARTGKSMKQVRDFRVA